jgi:hypothetical protein
MYGIAASVTWFHCSTVSITAGEDRFACMPSDACSGRVTLFAYFCKLGAVYFYSTVSHSLRYRIIHPIAAVGRGVDGIDAMA